jgi:DNA (cytosine-5)-methyltransferase 1
VFYRFSGMTHFGRRVALISTTAHRKSLIFAAGKMVSSPELAKRKFIDLFCGIGGLRLAFEAENCRCVFSSDWDRYAQVTYEKNFGEIPRGDIHSIAARDIPDHDILVGGFPCQPFSISGVSKKNSLNRPHGFEDKTQGTLFLEIKRILAGKRPQAFMLENVKHLPRHDGAQSPRPSPSLN